MALAFIRLKEGREFLVRHLQKLLYYLRAINLQKIDQFLSTLLMYSTQHPRDDVIHQYWSISY